MYNVKVYDRVTEGNKHITPHFQVKEFVCSDGSRVVFISDDLVNLLENIRVHYGKPLHINSAYRTVSYNSKLKDSSPNSKHLYGLAADIWVEGVAIKALYDYVCEALGNHGGVGIYNTFVHVDMRSLKSRWDKR